MYNSGRFLKGSPYLCTLVSEKKSKDTFSLQLFMISNFYFMTDVQECKISKVFASFFCRAESSRQNEVQQNPVSGTGAAVLSSVDQTKHIRY